MAKMINPELEVVRFENEDVIATSYWLRNGVWFRGSQTVNENDVPGTLPDSNGVFVNPSSPTIKNGHWIFANGSWHWVD